MKQARCSSTRLTRATTKQTRINKKESRKRDQIRLEVDRQAATALLPGPEIGERSAIFLVSSGVLLQPTVSGPGVDQARAQVAATTRPAELHSIVLCLQRGQNLILVVSALEPACLCDSTRPDRAPASWQAQSAVVRKKASLGDARTLALTKAGFLGPVPSTRRCKRRDSSSQSKALRLT